MKIETLKDNSKTKWIVGIIVFVVLVIGVATLATSLAKFQKTQSIPIVRGKISYKINDLEIVEINIQQEDGSYLNSDVIPTSGYTLNTKKSVCKVGEEKQDVTIEYVDGKININGLTKKGNKCYLYFDRLILAKDTILANKTIAKRTSFSSTLTANTTGTLYTAEDDDGTSYYYAGAVYDNWFKFGKENGKDIYWRIIRINGNGSIRMIYAGTDPSVTTGTGTYINGTAYKFNSSKGNHAYVGFMYTYDYAHGLETSSNAKTQLDTWYNNNLVSYASYIDIESGFCGDRSKSSNSGTNSIYYGAYNRLIDNKAPTYKCIYSSDLYTISSSSKGNKALTYPVGLITADEVAYAGGLYYQGVETSNIKYYLYTEKSYWTMTPMISMYNTPNSFPVSSDGALGIDACNHSYYSYFLRPVINLSPDVTLTGTGTNTDPYQIVET